MQEIMPLLSTP